MLLLFYLYLNTLRSKANLSAAFSGNGILSANFSVVFASTLRYLPFRDKCFDALYSHAVLQIVPESHLVLREIKRVVKANGRAVIMIPILESPHPAVAEEFPNRKRLEELELEVFYSLSEKLRENLDTDTNLTWKNLHKEIASAGLNCIGTRGWFTPFNPDMLSVSEFETFVKEETDILSERVINLGERNSNMTELLEIYNERKDWLIGMKKTGENPYGWSGVPLLVAICET